MSFARSSVTLSTAALTSLRTSLFAPSARTSICSHCLKQIRMQPQCRSTKNRHFATAAALRPQSPDFHSPPRNSDIPDTSISNGKSTIDSSSSNISLREGEAQKPYASSASLSAGSTVNSSKSSTDKKPRKSKLKARKAAMTLSPAAVVALRELLDQPEPKLIRVGVKNRGCSGLAYHLEYVDKPSAFDETVEQDGVKVLIDSKALFSIIGSQMDYVKDKLSQRFVFNNPNITESCGCGESFSVG